MVKRANKVVKRSAEIDRLITLKKMLEKGRIPDAMKDKVWTDIKESLQDPLKAEQSFGIAMKILATDEGKLDVDLINRIVTHLLTLKTGLEKIANHLKTISKHPDVLQHVWLSLSNQPEENTAETLEQLLILMAALPITTWEDCPLLVPDATFKFNYTKVRKAANACWTRAMRQQLNMVNRKHALTLLLENLLMHIEKPVLLTDFLMDSLDIGGPVSLLALQGVFTLIQEHNITYPNIYTKIYSLFEPDIFHTKYKARLFYLTDLFLSSTHLPENLVGAFVKRVSRLALIAPPQDITICLYFITNLIIRHKGLKRLLNDTETPQANVESDPFNMDEKEPTNSGALNSSLWEVEALAQHVLPSVSITAKNVLKGNRRTEYDLGQVLELTESDLFEKTLSSGAENKSYHLKILNSIDAGVDTDKMWSLY